MIWVLLRLFLDNGIKMDKRRKSMEPQPHPTGDAKWRTLNIPQPYSWGSLYLKVKIDGTDTNFGRLVEGPYQPICRDFKGSCSYHPKKLTKNSMLHKSHRLEKKLTETEPSKVPPKWFHKDSYIPPEKPKNIQKPVINGVKYFITRVVHPVAHVFSTIYRGDITHNSIYNC